MPNEFAKVVGANCRRLRAPASMEELADVARRFGMRWNSGSIAKIEAGSHKMTVQSLVVLAAALSALHDDPQIRVPELLTTDDAVEITPDVSVANGEILTAILAGETTLDEPAEDFISRKVRDTLAQAERRPPALGPLPPGFTLTAAITLRDKSTQSERRIARSMGANFVWFGAWCQHLWGRSFTEERDRRAGPGANAQSRGRVTRDLKTELQSAMDREHGDDRDL
ncbi:hypothetical protein ABLE92_24395 [Gordonia sp. VNQ95]|uniref:hypothetical protein n=1 Tax=Gordonia sp. VNQ95 TaxID=3156619 RepID=UPI0032B3AA0D